jgi:Protein of unknown function (DUF3606)
MNRRNCAGKIFGSHYAKPWSHVRTVSLTRFGMKRCFYSIIEKFAFPTINTVVTPRISLTIRNRNVKSDDPFSSSGSRMISKTVTPDRSKIIIGDEDHIRYWTRHFGVTKEELTRAIERVGNSAAAVRKELGAARSATSSLTS